MAFEVNIKNHRTGETAGVTNKNQLRVRAEDQSQRHFISREDGLAFQVEGTATSANGTTTVLHLENTNTNKLLCVSSIRLQTIGLAGGTALPDSGNYFELGFGRLYDTGGSTATSVNMNRDFNVTALATAYDSGPTLSGTFNGFDTWYPKEDADRNIYDKQGTILLGLNDTMEVRWVSDNTSGTAYTRINFYYVDLIND